MNFDPRPNPRHTNYLNPNYDKESLVREMRQAEFINQKGTQMDYYVVDFDVNKDDTFGEDTLLEAKRKFFCMAKFELPNEERVWNAFMIDGIDQFHMYISKLAFAEMSKYDSAGSAQIHPSHIPKEGDILKSRHNQKFYEIATVKDQDEQFHQRQVIWDIIVKPLVANSDDVSSELSGDELESIMNNDMFEDPIEIENESAKRDYIPSPSEEDIDPFFGFNGEING